MTSITKKYIGFYKVINNTQICRSELINYNKSKGVHFYYNLIWLITTSNDIHYYKAYKLI